MILLLILVTAMFVFYGTFFSIIGIAIKTSIDHIVVLRPDDQELRNTLCSYWAISIISAIKAVGQTLCIIGIALTFISALLVFAFGARVI